VVSKYLNKLLYIAILVFAAGFMNLIVTSSSYAACAKDADGSIIVTAGDSTPFALSTSPSTFDQNACQEEPDEYKLTFYKVALCSTDPYTNGSNPDYSDCVDVLNEEKEVIIKPDEDTDLLTGGLEIPLGTYNIIAIIVDNHVHLKTSQKYVLANGNPASIKGSSGTAGTYCWSEAAVTLYSNDASLDTDTTYEAAQGGVNVVESGTGTAALTGAQLECGAEGDINAAFATEIIDTIADPTHDGEDNYQFGASMDYGDNSDLTGMTGSQLAANLLKTDNTTLAANEDQARRIAGFFKYPNNPIVITEDTNSFKLELSTTESVSIDMAVDGSDVIWGAKMGGDPFTIRVETTEAF
tara:strand:+ start:1254 stop:2315 length:1062 start_codon:yes stop_codon:yes gene_type:complete